MSRNFYHAQKPGPVPFQGSYFAPVRKLAIKPGASIEYHVYRTLGNVLRIRARSGEIARTMAKSGGQKEE